MVDDSKVRFDESIKLSKTLKRAAKVAVVDVLKVKKNERVLIITNPNHDVQKISMALYDAALVAGAKPTVIFQPMKTQLDFAEDAVIFALRAEPEVILSISHEKLGKDRFAMKKPYKHKGKKLDHIFHYLLAAKKARSFWSPSVTIKMFEDTVPINYKKLGENSGKLKKIFDKSDEVHITNKFGTDLVIGIRGRKAFADSGEFSKPGDGGNLPAGEMFISPELDSSNGILVFDGSIASDKGVILIKKPIKCTVKNNLVTKISGGTEAKKLQDALKRAETTTKKFVKEGKLPKKDMPEYLKNIYNLGELGIGLNEKAKIVGNMLEDEKVFKTCHVAIGMNYDEDARALIHFDGLISNPTMETVDKKGGKTLVMKDGKIVI
ncbi:aminopeptidase [[Eubacterium] cellulosolvens]